MDTSLNGSARSTGPALDVRRLLRDAGLRPRKSLGQHFLVREEALQRVTAAAGIRPSDTALEIGAGVGSLTRHLAAAAGRVVAVEIDPHLFPILHAVLDSFPNVTLVLGDILALPMDKLMGNVDPGGYTVAANIPYYITSAVIRRLMESPAKPGRIVLTVQQEVAERICARPGEMNLLALSVQYYGKPSIEGKIPAESFYPAPEVDSAIVRVDLGEVPSDPELTGRLFRIARAGFSQKRKKLRNTLSAALRLPAADAERALARAGVDPGRRAETVSVEEWIRIAGGFPLPE